ncbi:hypothetical protein, partial [Chloroflexus sp.]|uniref:hypothetical protein n=1 Tax=Chloroflexus sp. TaxID=1904827 RepID=UPI002FDAF060
GAAMTLPGLNTRDQASGSSTTHNEKECTTTPAPVSARSIARRRSKGQESAIKPPLRALRARL